ncbi:MAG: NRDE family protein [Planctomycetota bacterium]
MSLLAIVYHLVPEAPILVAYNREEPFDRNFPTPSIQAGKPRVLASIDPHTGGTYLGMNQNGLFVGVVRRKKYDNPMSLRSRGSLAREMLKCNSATQAVDLALEELHSGHYGSANFCVADPDSGWVIQSGKEADVFELKQGLCVVGERDVNDPMDERARMATRLLTLQTLDSPVKFLAIASKVLARTQTVPGRPSMVVKEKNYGTVSSTLISLGKKPRDAIYQYSNGSPDKSKFEDYSPLLRDILSRGLREARARAEA